MKIKIEKSHDLDTSEINLEGGYAYSENGRNKEGKYILNLDFGQFTMILEPEFENEMEEFLSDIILSLKNLEESEDTNSK